MRSNIGLDALEPENLYEWLVIYREDVADCGVEAGFGWKAKAWALQTCTKIVLILASKNYDPRTKKPPRAVESVAAVSSTPFQEIQQS
jgi:hypothetical protein